MIIFGTRSVTYNKGKGSFHCPGCGDTRAYAHKRVRRFFTLYFIPLIPLDLLGEYVECSGCDNTYKPSVLEFDPAAEKAAFESEFQVAVRRVMIRMMLADGAMDAAEVDTVRTVFEQLAGRPLSADEVLGEATTLQAQPESIRDMVGKLVGSLNGHGKESVVRAVYLVAAADGDFADEEMALIQEIGEALEMTPVHVQGVLATVGHSA